jgi:hypothetical protein
VSFRNTLNFFEFFKLSCQKADCFESPYEEMIIFTLALSSFLLTIIIKPGFFEKLVGIFVKNEEILYFSFLIDLNADNHIKLNINLKRLHAAFLNFLFNEIQNFIEFSCRLKRQNESPYL